MSARCTLTSPAMIVDRPLATSAAAASRNRRNQPSLKYQCGSSRLRPFGTYTLRTRMPAQVAASSRGSSNGGGGSSGAGSDESIAPLPTTPDTVVPPATRPAGPDGGVVEPDALPIPQDGAVPAPAASANQGSDEWKWLVGLLAVAALGAAPQLIRRLRQAPRGDASDQVLAAWRRAQRAAVRGGVVSAPAMTARTWAAATGDALPMAARPMASLAEVVDLVTFARSDVLDLRHSGISGQTIVDDCRRWADQVVAVADDLLDQRHKLWRYFTAYD